MPRGSKTTPGKEDRERLRPEEERSDALEGQAENAKGAQGKQHRAFLKRNYGTLNIEFFKKQ